LDDNAIEVSEEVLSQIGKTKCFDIKNNCVIDCDFSKQIASQKTIEKINSLKKQLADTDYKVLKFFEGEMSDEQFEPVRELRSSLRQKIKELEKKED